MSRERYGREFGGFTFLGDNADKEGFFDLPVREQAFVLGWSNGCPRARELSEPEHPHYGPEWIKQRYGETNFWFGVVINRAGELNPNLAEQLTRYRERRPDEPVGHFEPESVPESYVREISPMSGLWGYAIPRVLIEGFGRGSSRTQERMLEALNILEEVLPEAESPEGFLAVLSERVAWETEGDPTTILSHILPKGLLEEHNCYADFNSLAEQLQEKAPALWVVYQGLSPQLKDRFEIASL